MNNILYKVQQYLGKASKESVKLDKRLVEEFGEACKNALLKQFEDQRRNKFEPRMSNIGRPLCQLQMEAKGVKGEGQPYNVKVRNTFGDIIEALAIFIMKSAGVNIKNEQKKVKYKFNGNEIEGTFSWTPDISHISTTPYTVVFRTTDQTFYYDETILFEVASATDVENIDGSDVEGIYPNPASNNIYIPLNIDHSQTISLDIYNLLGTKVYEGREVNLSAGNHILMQDIDLKNGQYFITISGNNIILSTKRIIISK